ncbi:MAG: YncE family protein [candidate division WOR-3 bacterium]
MSRLNFLQCKITFISLITLHLTFFTSFTAQWLETTIFVPDSFCGIIYPKAFAYNITNNKIYVGGKKGDCVIVIDGETNEKIAKIMTGSRIYTSDWNEANHLVWNATNNKVYCANQYASNNVTVIDGASDSVITTIPVGGTPYALVWNATNNKIYCANWATLTVTVIDGVGDSVIATIPVGLKPYALAWNATNNKVYCANLIATILP